MKFILYIYIKLNQTLHKIIIFIHISIHCKWPRYHIDSNDSYYFTKFPDVCITKHLLHLTSTSTVKATFTTHHVTSTCTNRTENTKTIRYLLYHTNISTINPATPQIRTSSGTCPSQINFTYHFHRCIKITVYHSVSTC